MLTRARAAQQRPTLSALDDDLITEVLCRTPAFTHDVLTAVWKRFLRLVRDHSFDRLVRSGHHSEPVVLAFGGWDRYGYGHHHENLLALVAGHWVFCIEDDGSAVGLDMPVWGPNLYSAMIRSDDNDYLVVVGGGCLERFDEHADGPLAVHAYDVHDKKWRVCDLDGSPAQRWGAAFAHAGETILMAGGAIEDYESSSGPTRYAAALKLTAHTPMWHELPPMPHAVLGCVGFVIEKQLHSLNVAPLRGHVDWGGSISDPCRVWVGAML